MGFIPPSPNLLPPSPLPSPSVSLPLKMGSPPAALLPSPSIVIYLGHLQESSLHLGNGPWELM